MNAADIKDLVGSLGFPIFVAGWLLFRTDKILQHLVIAINSLKECVDTMSIRSR